MSKFVEMGGMRGVRAYDVKSSHVFLERHNPKWSRLFHGEKRAIADIESIKPHILAVHHVGSTAIPQLDAKPIVDILIDVPSMDSADKIIPYLEGIGYEHLPQEREYTNRRFLRKYITADENYHVHVTTVEENNWRERLLIFRDYLLAHPDAAREYMHLKQQLAQQYADDRYTYARKKDEFIQPIIEAERKRMTSAAL